MRSSLLLLTIAAIVGCTTARKSEFENSLNSWVGKPKDSLVESWGPPHSVYQMNSGDEMLTYQESRSLTIVQPMPGTRGFYAAPVNRSCQTTFIVSREGVIDRWQYKGNGCY